MKEQTSLYKMQERRQIGYPRREPKGWRPSVEQVEDAIRRARQGMYRKRMEEAGRWDPHAWLWEPPRDPGDRPGKEFSRRKPERSVLDQYEPIY